MSTTTIILIVGVLAVIGAVLVSANRTGQAAAPDVRVLSQLRQVGSQLDQPHKIDFFLYCSTKAAADQVATQISAEGFSVQVQPSAKISSEWVVQAKRTMVPDLKVLVELRERFSALASANGGSYDGWGAEVVR